MFQVSVICHCPYIDLLSDSALSQEFCVGGPPDISVAFWACQAVSKFDVSRSFIFGLPWHLRFEFAFWCDQICVLGAPLALRLRFGVAF